jgi:electron transport complex protein RnfB
MKHHPTAQDQTDLTTLVAHIDKDICIGCGDCVDICPNGAFSITVEKEGVLPLELCVGCGLCETKCPMGAIKERKRAVLDQERCTGCGSCVKICPAHAIKLVRWDELCPDPDES